MTSTLRTALVFGAAYLASLAFNRGARAAEPLDGALEKIRAEHHLPSLAVIAMRDGQILAQSAIGVRKLGSPEVITTSDRWHIGSCTKSMTATLAAMFVEQGKLSWTTTIGEIFPEWKDEMVPAWRTVTLEQLLTHRSGASKTPPPELWAEARKEIGTPTAQRLAFIHGIMSREPEAAPGTKFIYSNHGYSIAGAMLERVTGKAWEDLIQELLFKPLAMSSAGFGAPASLGQIDQPWGHAGKPPDLQPVAPGPGADNPPAIGPAGTVHCSLADLARYATMHAEGERKGWGILKPETFVKLHTAAPGQEYGMGWFVTKRGWAGGKALTHAGSNTMFMTDVWIAPEKNAVFISATNAGGDEASKACDQAVAAVIERFLP